MTCGSMAAASLRRIGMSLPAIRSDVEWTLVKQDVAVSIGGIGAGWSAKKRDSAITDTLASIAEPVELDGMMASKRKLEISEFANKTGGRGVLLEHPKKISQGGVAAGCIWFKTNLQQSKITSIPWQCMYSSPM